MTRISDRHLVQLVEGDTEVPHRIVIRDESTGEEIAFLLPEADRAAKAIGYLIAALRPPEVDRWITGSDGVAYGPFPARITS